MRRLCLLLALALLCGLFVSTALPVRAHDGDHSCTIIGTEGDDNNLMGTEGDDVICGLGGDDFIGGAGGHDHVYGGTGDDFLMGGEGDDFLFGGPGSDNMDADAGNDYYDGDPEIGFDECNRWDYVQFGQAPGPINATIGGSARGFGNDTIQADVEGIIGGAYADTLTGNEGDNYLNGQDGNDTLTGSGGYDQLEGSRGNDTLDGGTGVDEFNSASYFDATTGVTVNLTTGAANDGIPVDPMDPSSQHGSDTLMAINSVYGSEHADVLTGDAQQNALFGFDGADVISGLDNADHLAGGTGDDDLMGGGDHDYIDENDRFFFGQVPDPTDADDLFGGTQLEGTQDVVDYSFRPNPVTVTFDDQPNDGEANENDNVHSDVEDVILPEERPTTTDPGGCGSSGTDPDPEPDADFTPPPSDPVTNAATVSGTVLYADPADTTGNTLLPLANAEVRMCEEPTYTHCDFDRTDAAGSYTLANVAPGPNTMDVFPPFEPAAGVPTDLMSKSVFLDAPSNGTVTGVNVTLERPKRIPDDTTITNRGVNDGIPTVPYNAPLDITTRGCPGGTATYRVTMGDEVVASGTLTEGSAGVYSGQIPALERPGQKAEVATTIDCPGTTPDEASEFNIYIDPSGFVRTTDGTPITNATVSLYRSDSATGPFTIVPDGSAIMSPANRRNPDLTDGTGHFGWDVIAGYYLVRAEAPGCVDPTDPTRTFVESRIMLIPPPVFDLDLRLSCTSNTGGGGGTPVPTPTQPPGDNQPSDPEPTVHDRSVRLRISRHLVVRGSIRVADGFASCASTIAVNIQRRNRDGEWRVAERLLTDADGTFRARIRDRAGVYRAVAPDTFTTEAPEDVCAGARSTRVRHTHL